MSVHGADPYSKFAPFREIMRKRKPVSPSLLDKQHGQEVIEVRHLFIRARSHCAVIEEAWRRARRRRLIYAGIALSLAIIGAVVTATVRGPSSSSSTPAAVASASPAAPVNALAVSASGPHRYHLLPTDTVDVRGGAPFDWSCTLTLGRVFECWGPAEWTRPKPHPLLRIVVFQDGLLVQRGHKTVYFVNR